MLSLEKSLSRLPIRNMTCRPAERHCEQMHQHGQPETTHRTIQNILLVGCTIVFDRWNQWYRHSDFSLYSWAWELRMFRFPLAPRRKTTTSSQNSKTHPKQGRKVVGVSTVKGWFNVTDWAKINCYTDFTGDSCAT